MQIIHSVKNPAIAMVFALVLSSCASNSGVKLAESFASQRAEMLNSIVPVNMNGYNLIRAQANSDEIELTLLYSGQEGVASPMALARELTEAYCLDNEIVSLMQTGVKYRLLFRDSRGRPVHQHSVTQQTCA